MLAMTLLMIDFTVMPVLALVLVALLAVYGVCWSRYRASGQEGR